MRRFLNCSFLACILLSGCSDFEVDREVTIVVPSSAPSIANGSLVVVLYRYDPLLADGPASSAFRSEISFAHRSGTRTVRTVRVQGQSSGRDQFYLSVTGCDRGVSPAQAVLWDGLMVEIPSRVTMQVREVPYDCALD